jgi:hypothetical protein
MAKIPINYHAERDDVEGKLYIVEGQINPALKEERSDGN